LFIFNCLDFTSSIFNSLWDYSCSSCLCQSDWILYLSLSLLRVLFPMVTPLRVSFQKVSPQRIINLIKHVLISDLFIFNCLDFTSSIFNSLWDYSCSSCLCQSDCIALFCTIVLRRRLNSKKRSTWARKWLRRQRWDVFLWSLLYLQSFH
jgi:hypothetical protein